MAIVHTFKSKSGTVTEKLNPIKAIRRKCQDCSNWFDPEIKQCVINDCALWPFRMGKAHSTRKVNVEALQKARFARQTLYRTVAEKKTISG